jgi:hypothetical protein
MKPRAIRRRLAIEAVAVFAVARLALRVVSAQRLIAWAAHPPRRIRRFADPAWPELVSAAVTRVAARLQPKDACLPCALATQFMLRRRGIVSRLCLGVRRGGDARLSAHAWVEIGDKMVIGATEEPYRQLVSYGPAAAAGSNS